MPAKNTVKINVKDGYYHVYNRGVEKRTIFEDKRDYEVFLKFLKESLSPPPDPKTVTKTFSLQGSTFKGVPRLPKNFHNEIELVAYCLMPNHFHFLIKQKQLGAMKSFMQSLITRYVIYFNKRHKRVGSLFQGIYKATLINKDAYLLHLSRYIHLNPTEQFTDIKNAYSSYLDFLGKRNTPWLKPDIVLSFFNQEKLPFLQDINTYRNFAEDYQEDSQSILGDLTLEG